MGHFLLGHHEAIVEKVTVFLARRISPIVLRGEYRWQSQLPRKPGVRPT